MNKKNVKNRKVSFNVGYIFRNLITALAVINLVLLFVLDYNVPGISNIITKIENKRDHIDGMEDYAVSEDGNVTFEYSTEVFTFTGEEAFDPTTDVTVRDTQGNELDKSGLSVQITGDSEKEIVYNYNSADGQYYGSDTRSLQLDNYEGPTLVANGDIPSITDDNLVDITQTCQQVYTATDGYGNDISQNITATAVPDEAYDGFFSVQLSVKNIFGDTAQATAQVATDFELPHMKLTQEEVQIQKGTSFDPASYILYAVDYDGSDIRSLVVYDSNVDTLTTGDYKVKYDLTDDSGISVKRKKLIVHVVE